MRGFWDAADAAADADDDENRSRHGTSTSMKKADGTSHSNVFSDVNRSCQYSCLSKFIGVLWVDFIGRVSRFELGPSVV